MSDPEIEMAENGVSHAGTPGSAGSPTRNSTPDHTETDGLISSDHHTIDMPGPSAPIQPNDVTTHDAEEAAEDEDDALIEPGASDQVMVALSYLVFILLFPIAVFQSFVIVKTYERAVTFRLGKLKSHEAQTGLVFQLPCTDSVQVVDIRTRTVNIAPQEILTRDSVTCAVDGVLFYEVIKPSISVTKIENVEQAIELLASTSLRTTCGHRTLPEILSAREEISRDILVIVEQRAKSWGIRVLRVDLKDMKLAPQLQRALVAEAEASRTAKAKVIQADGEQKAALILKNASEILTQSETSVQLRYLQTLGQISGTNNKTIVFPLPPQLAEKAIQGLVNMF